MSAKNFILDFISYLFIIALVTFCLFFFISGDNFAEFTELMRSLIPLAIFGIAFLIKMKLSRGELSRKKEEGALDVVLYLNYMDKLKTDVLLYLTPITIIIAPFLVGLKPELPDVLQASLAFIIFYFWQKYLFAKGG